VASAEAIYKKRALVDAFMAADSERILGLQHDVANGGCLGALAAFWRCGVLFDDEEVEATLVETVVAGCDMHDPSAVDAARGLPGAGPVFLWGLPALSPCGLARWLSGFLDIHAAGPLPFMPLALEETLSGHGLNLWTADGLHQALSLYPRRLAESYMLASSNHRGEKPAFVDSLPQSLLVAPLLAQVFPDSRMLVLRGTARQECAALVNIGMAADEAERRQARYHQLASFMIGRLGSRVRQVDISAVYAAPAAIAADISAFLKLEPVAPPPALPEAWRAGEVTHM